MRFNEATKLYQKIAAKLPEPDLKNFLGFGTSKFDITSSIRQNISPLVREIQQGSSKFTDRAGERNLSRNVNQEQLEEMFKDDLVQHSDKSLLLRGILNLYDRLGIDNEQIRRGLTRFDAEGFAGIPTDRTLQTVQNSRDNFYVPFNINKNTLARIYGNNPNIDLQRIFEIQDSVYGTRLE